MKRIFEKNGVLRSVGFLMTLVSFILFIVAAFIGNYTADMILKSVGILLFTVGGLIVTINSKDHQLVKSLLVIVAAAIISSWLYPYGYFQGTDFSEYGFRRIGIVDLGYALYYAINFVMDKITFLLITAGFYGVVSKTSGYQKLVTGIAGKLKNKPIITSICISVLLFVFTSLFSQTFVVILFIPFFVSILAKMNMDKLTTFAVTFGSALVGVLGATYGTDALVSFNYYMGQELSVGLTYRFIVAAVALVLYDFFIVMRIKKVANKDSKKSTNTEKVEDPFEVENPRTKKGSLPVIIVLCLIAIITILGYINWQSNFKIEVFNSFHEWLTTLEAGEGFTIFSYILGANANAFGAFSYVFTIGGMLLLASALLAYLYHMSLDEYFQNFYEGLKKAFKPILYVIGVYIVFGICYLSPFVPTLANWVLNFVVGFNPFLTTLIAFITSLFHADLGYSSYLVGGFVSAVYADNIDIAHTIFTSMYGLVQVFMPTSLVLVTGLSLMKVNYKDWFKYIWLFVVGMLVVLLVLFTVVTYI